ncbi:MAG: uroporphyrinogen decarboxylase family protein [Thermodesulfobacteriota bacterium]
MSNAQQLLLERERRFNDAVALKKPDRVPIATMWDFFPARWKGISVKAVMYDPQLMFDSWVECLEHFQPDMGENPFALRGLARVIEALDFQHLKWAGHGLGDNMSYQFVELEVMKADEYDHFLFDTTDFMIRRYWPRVYKALAPLENLPPLNQVISYFWGLYSGVFLLSPEMEAARNAMIEAAKASAEVLKWAGAFAKKLIDMGFPIPSGGYSQVPFDTLGDVFRGTKGIMMDMYRRPDKVMAACEKLLPIMIDSAVASAKRTGVPRVFIPLHKGLDNFMSPDQFHKFYWPHMKELLEALIREGITPWVLAEGICNNRLEAFRDVPPGKVIYHFEATDMVLAKDMMKDRCCIRGNVPMSLLTVGTPEEVRAYCKKLIDTCAVDGGFIMDASAPLSDAKPENVQAMYDFTKDYGV